MTRTLSTSIAVSDGYSEEEIRGLYDADHWRRESFYDDVRARARMRPEVVESLPMTATGKVQKHVLRDDIAAKPRG
jgi:acyl-coenzyme A synthetase/AMP-(fatty) acid ligase